MSAPPRSEPQPSMEDAPTTEAGFALSETVIGGRFRVGERLSWGGMGTVYRALDLQTGREVAVKLPHIGAPGATAARFEREAAAVASMVCSSVIGYVAHGSLDEPYLAMELVIGEPLWKRLTKAALDERATLLLARRVAGALASIHLCGWVHRDVKPGNIVVGDDGAIKLLDFGLSRTLDGGASTAKNDLIGTLGYLAPEQFRGGRVLDPRTDVFSFGVVLYECLTGRRAYRRSVKHLADRDVGPPLDVRAAGIRGPIAELVQSMVDHDPERRPLDGIDALARLLWLGSPTLVPADLGPVRTALKHVLRTGSVALVGSGPGSATPAAAAVAAILAEMVAPTDVAVVGSDPSFGAEPLRHAQAVAEALSSRGFVDLARRFDPSRPRSGASADPEKRVVLIVEDAGWCDAASREAFARLAAEHAIALVLTASTNDAADALGVPIVAVEGPPSRVASLDALTPFERWVLRAASMFGLSVPPEGVMELVGGAEASDVPEALLGLVERGVLRAADSRGVYAFSNSAALSTVRKMATGGELRLGAHLCQAFRDLSPRAPSPRVAWPTSTEDRFSELARASAPSG